MRTRAARTLVALVLVAELVGCPKRPTASAEPARPAAHPAPPPPAPRPEEKEASPAAAWDDIRDTLDRAQALRAILAGRTLSEDQAALSRSAAGLLEQARKAVDEKDAERASTLLGKAVTLYEDLEKQTRPR